MDRALAGGERARDSSASRKPGNSSAEAAVTHAPKVLFTTARLSVRRLCLADAAFIQGLVTQPEWLRWIGSRDVESLEDAERYLRDGPLHSYEQHGHGLYLVTLIATEEPIGICGLLKRDTLSCPDLGYAIASRYEGHGYATEAAKATLQHAQNDLGFTKVLAITDPEYAASHRVLIKVGMQRTEATKEEGGSNVALFWIDLFAS